MTIYLALVLIRPQDYPVLAESMAGVPLLPISLIMTALFWAMSPRKSFDAPQYIILPIFMLFAMATKVANGWVGGIVLIAAYFGPVVIAFVLMANTVNTTRRLIAMMAVFTICACVMSLHGIEQVQLGVGWTGIGLSQETRIQYVGIFNDPNDLGMVFIMCLPMAMLLAGRGGMMGLRRLFWLLVAAVLVYGVYLTDSRGSLLALVVMLGVYVWRKRGIVTAGALGAVALVGLMMLPSRLQEMEVSEDSAMGRVDAWYEGLQMFFADPVFGIGAGGYSDLNQLTAHNSFVLVLTETGFIGFTLWLAFIGYGFRMVLAVLNQPEDLRLTGWLPEDADEASVGQLQQAWTFDRKIALALLLSLCGFFACAFFLSRGYVIILYLQAALVVGYYTLMRTRYPDLPEFKLGDDVIRWPLYAVIGVISLYIVVKILLAMA
ncbi:MAG: O-antigen ligase family protein [Luteimonas sp.]